MDDQQHVKYEHFCWKIAQVGCYFGGKGFFTTGAYPFPGKDRTHSVGVDRNRYLYCNPIVDGAPCSLGCHYLVDLPAENLHKIRDNYCGLLVVQGSGTYRDWDGRQWELREGSFAQHIPGKWHSIRRKQEGPSWIERSIAMDPSMYHHLVSLGCIDPDTPVFYPKNWRRIAGVFRKLAEDIAQASPSESTREIMQAQKVLYSVLAEGRVTRPATKTDPVITEACNELGRDFGQKADLKALAARLNISYAHFRRLFRHKTGVSPGAYRIQRRVERAKSYLAEGQLSVKAIAMELGYPDPFVFSKQFRKVTGTSPSAFQQSRQHLPA